MIAQITPLVQVAGKRSWLAVVSAHALGAVASAAVLGCFLGALGALVPFNSNAPAVRVLGSAFVFLCALRDAAVWRWPLISMKRQVRAWFPRVLGWKLGAFAWGADLGQGWTTYIESAGYYALVLWCVLVANPILASIVLAAYGLRRALPLVAIVLVGKGNAGDLDFLLNMGTINVSVLRISTAIALAFAGGFLVA